MGFLVVASCELRFVREGAGIGVRKAGNAGGGALPLTSPRQTGSFPRTNGRGAAQEQAMAKIGKIAGSVCFPENRDRPQNPIKQGLACSFTSPMAYRPGEGERCKHLSEGKYLRVC